MSYLAEKGSLTHIFGSHTTLAFICLSLQNNTEKARELLYNKQAIVITTIIKSNWLSLTLIHSKNQW